MTASAGVTTDPDVAASVPLGVGRVCTRTGLVLLPRTTEGARIEADLARHIAAAPAVTLLDDHVHDSFIAGRRALEADDGVRVLATGGTAAGAATPALYGVVGAPVPDVALKECFGPVAVHSQAEDGELLKQLVATLAPRFGRLVFGQYPTGVAIDVAMQHAGPGPSSTDPRFGSVGTPAIDRFLRPIAYQNALPSYCHAS